MIKFITRYHNKIQLFGYEIANLLLLFQGLKTSHTFGYSFNYETLTAVSFLIASGFIYSFDFVKRPAMLFVGGVFLTLGGLCLFLAGYAVTGITVIIASLETARGGLHTLKSRLDELKIKPVTSQSIYYFGIFILSPYILPIEKILNNLPPIGKFINDRPFVTGLLIKAPGRIEFIAKNILQQNIIGIIVGFSWFVFGDCALALNDMKLNRYIDNKLKK